MEFAMGSLGFEELPEALRPNNRVAVLLPEKAENFPGAARMFHCR
jgi:hypothetical protein